MQSKNEKTIREEDYLDRFAEVVKGLEIEKTIANKLANFIYVEIEIAKKKAIHFLYEKIEQRILNDINVYGDDYVERVEVLALLANLFEQEER